MSADDFLQKRKDELLRTMSEVNSEAREKERQALEIARTARQTQDMTGPFLDLVNEMPVELLAAPVWDRQIDVMREWLGVATNDSLPFGTMASTFRVVTAAVANTCATVMYTVSSESEAAGLKIHAIESAEARLADVIRPSQLLETVHASMSRLGLESQGGAGIRSPLDLLTEAQKALENPTFGEGRAASVLLPLRGCIDRCLDMLLKRRSAQESAPKKIQALGLSCGRATLSADFFAGLQTDYEGLNDRLSSAKDRDLPRQRIIALFNQGLTFLDALLSSVDEGRLKPPKT